MGRSESARHFTEGARPVHDVDHEDLALICDPHPCRVKRPTKSRQIVVVHEHMDSPFAISSECGQALDVNAAGTGSLTQASQLAGAIVKNNEHVSCHLKSDVPTRRDCRQAISRWAQLPLTAGTSSGRMPHRWTRSLT
jgi:hypothetical protein